MTVKLTLDFETRSEADLNQVGAYAYSMHPSTDVTCLGWWSPVGNGQWRMGDPAPIGLFYDLCMEVDVAEAHNAEFEMFIWENVCVRRYGWPAIPFDMWRCSAAKAAAMALPRDLAGAGRAAGVEVVKDVMAGKSAMMKIAKPRKPTKADQSKWNMDTQVWADMLAYNMNDVMSEVALSDSLPDLTARELKLWQLTERMNHRGFPVDVDGLRHAIRIAGEHQRRLTAVFQSITGIESAGQRGKFLAWLNAQGIAAENTQADTLDALLTCSSNTIGAGQEKTRLAIEIVRQLGMSSVKKYRAMYDSQVGGRVHGCFLYFGAQATGRWAGRGAQPQNYPRAAPIKDQEVAWRAIETGDVEVLGLLAEPQEALSGALRGAICAPPGRTLMAGDYAQIEARKVFWLAGCERALDIFRDRRRDMYCEQASMIFDRLITKADANERFLGKQATLALGFQAGFVKYLVHCRKLGAPAFTREQVHALVPASQRGPIEDYIRGDGWKMVTNLIPRPTAQDVLELVLTKHVTNRFRAENWELVEMWAALDKAARAALATPGRWFKVNDRLAFGLRGRFLEMRLPSGRTLKYPDPQIVGRDLTYMGIDPKTKQWVRKKAYGGLLAENATQASARDIMADAMLRLEAAPPYSSLVMTVHDEVVSECIEGESSLAEFIRLMEVVPDWCHGMPIVVDGWEGRRYRKA